MTIHFLIATNLDYHRFADQRPGLDDVNDRFTVYLLLHHRHIKPYRIPKIRHKTWVHGHL